MEEDNGKDSSKITRTKKRIYRGQSKTN